MNLAIDIGNTSAKAALFDGRRLVRVFNGPEKLPAVERVIVVSTRGGGTDFLAAGLSEAGFGEIDFTEVRFKEALRLDHSTPVPIKNLYATPETLGYDRLAAAVGAWAMFPGKTALVVDFGTAITYDIITGAGEFLGGNISPGAGSRFRSLHDYTGTLPLCALTDEAGEESSGELLEFPAKTTKDAIRGGVVQGIVAETESYIEEAKIRFGEIGIIFTGGDADYFAGRVKFPIFATSELVFHGLNAILEHNANL